LLVVQVFRRWQRADLRGRAAAAAEREAYQQQPPPPAQPPPAPQAAVPLRAGARGVLAVAPAATVLAAAKPVVAVPAAAEAAALPPPGSPELAALVAVCEWAAAAASAGARPQDLASLYARAPAARAAVKACGGARPYCDKWAAFLTFTFEAVAAGNAQAGPSAKLQRKVAKVNQPHNARTRAARQTRRSPKSVFRVAFN
jgi:hypothetical protein